MNINLRTDAPDQTDIIDPTLLSEAIEQLKTVGAQVLAAEIKLKELKSQYDYISGITIPQLMDKMNLKTLKLKRFLETVGREDAEGARLSRCRRQSGRLARGDSLRRFFINNLITVSRPALQAELKHFSALRPGLYWR